MDNWKGLLSQAPRLHNTPGTFQIPGDPLSGPPVRKLGLYLTHYVARFLQMIPSASSKWAFTSPLEPQPLQSEKVPLLRVLGSC